jgi:uncharacterized protein (UPF0335 family)
MSRVIGNEIFKTIVTMAYEMELAHKVLSRMSQRRSAVEDLMKTGQTFRDDDDILTEVKKYLAISPDNKKHWRFEQDDEYRAFILKKEIPISVSGRYRIMLSIHKHLVYKDSPRVFYNNLYIYLRDNSGEDVDDEPYHYSTGINPPTVFTVAIIERLALEREFHDIRDTYNRIYMPIESNGKNCKIWNKRLRIMAKDHMSYQLYHEIRRRYGVTASNSLLYDWLH